MTALITGAGGGIGYAIYEALKASGKSVLAQDLVVNGHIKESLVGNLCDHGFLDTLKGTLDDLTDCQLDTVIAAHGIAGAGRLAEIPQSHAERIMAVNFESVINLWEQVKDRLAANKGTFVVIVSQAGLVGEAGNAVYCASKFALAGWLRGLDAQTSVRLRGVHPGGIRTPLLEKALHEMADAQRISYEALLEKRYARSPAGRIGQPAEVAAIVAQLIALHAPQLVEVSITGGEVLW